ncbi:MAG: hypothetical protein ABW061_25580 [Polyangiaceae bacterium]
MILPKNLALLVASSVACVCVCVACGSSTTSAAGGGKGGNAGSGGTGTAGNAGTAAGSLNGGDAGAAAQAGVSEGGEAGASAGAGGAQNDGEAGANEGGVGGVNEGGAAGSEDLTLGDVSAVVTCDNAYGFGWGNLSGLNNYRVAPAALTAGDIFFCAIGPEGYVVPSAEAPPSAYLYSVAWGDHAVTQGLIGQFQRAGGTPVYTGDPGWQVCATGIDFDTSSPTQQAGPTLAQINAEIVECNAGTGDRATSSAGWVNATGAVTPNAIGKLAIGEDNSSAGLTFPIVCPSGGASPGLDAQARWMWYSSTGVGDAFQFSTLDVSRPFLIFRLAAGALPATN